MPRRATQTIVTMAMVVTMSCAWFVHLQASQPPRAARLPSPVAVFSSWTMSARVVACASAC
jgi:hypothetical protein